MSYIITKNTTNFQIDIMIIQATETNNSKILHAISVADSYLNEFTKENSVNKGISILSEIISSNLSNNKKNIINIIFSKCFDCFIKTNDQTKCILNFFFKKYKNEFSLLFINKDMTHKLSYEIYNPNSLTRLYYMELIKILPNLILNKIDLIHSIFDLLTKDHTLIEEKFFILEILNDNILKDNYLVKVLLENLNFIIKEFINFSHVKEEKYRLIIEILKVVRALIDSKSMYASIINEIFKNIFTEFCDNSFFSYKILSFILRIKNEFILDLDFLVRLFENFNKTTSKMDFENENIFDNSETFKKYYNKDGKLDDNLVLGTLIFIYAKCKNKNNPSVEKLMLKIIYSVFECTYFLDFTENDNMKFLSENILEFENLNNNSLTKLIGKNNIILYLIPEDKLKKFKIFLLLDLLKIIKMKIKVNIINHNDKINIENDLNKQINELYSNKDDSIMKIIKEFDLNSFINKKYNLNFVDILINQETKKEENKDSNLNEIDVIGDCNLSEFLGLILTINKLRMNNLKFFVENTIYDDNKNSHKYQTYFIKFNEINLRKQISYHFVSHIISKNQNLEYKIHNKIRKVLLYEIELINFQFETFNKVVICNIKEYFKESISESIYLINSIFIFELKYIQNLLDDDLNLCIISDKYNKLDNKFEENLSSDKKNFLRDIKNYVLNLLTSLLDKTEIFLELVLKNIILIKSEENILNGVICDFIKLFEENLTKILRTIIIFIKKCFCYLCKENDIFKKLISISIRINIILNKTRYLRKKLNDELVLPFDEFYLELKTILFETYNVQFPQKYKIYLSYNIFKELTNFSLTKLNKDIFYLEEYSKDKINTKFFNLVNIYSLLTNFIKMIKENPNTNQKIEICQTPKSHNFEMFLSEYLKFLNYILEFSKFVVDFTSNNEQNINLNYANYNKNLDFIIEKINSLPLSSKKILEIQEDHNLDKYEKEIFKKKKIIEDEKVDFLKNLMKVKINLILLLDFKYTLLYENNNLLFKKKELSEISLDNFSEKIQDIRKILHLLNNSLEKILTNNNLLFILFSKNDEIKELLNLYLNITGLMDTNNAIFSINFFNLYINEIKDKSFILKFIFNNSLFENIKFSIDYLDGIIVKFSKFILNFKESPSFIAKIIKNHKENNEYIIHLKFNNFLKELIDNYSCSNSQGQDIDYTQSQFELGFQTKYNNNINQKQKNFNLYYLIFVDEKEILKSEFDFYEIKKTFNNHKLKFNLRNTNNLGNITNNENTPKFTFLIKIEFFVNLSDIYHFKIHSINSSLEI